MAKSDIESAFRLLPIHPGDFHLLGLKNNDLYYVDKCLPMGAASAPALFETFSSLIEWSARENAHGDRILHYCDDFFIFGGSGEGKQSCAHALHSFIATCKQLGVPLASDKTEGPVSKITYLGLEIDARNQLVRIPPTKLSAIQSKLDWACTVKKVTLQQFRSIIGLLAFVCKAVPPGRAFLRRLIGLTCGVRKSYHKIRFSVGAVRICRCGSRFWLLATGQPLYLINFGLWIEISNSLQMQVELMEWGFFSEMSGSRVLGRKRSVAGIYPLLGWSFFQLLWQQLCGVTSWPAKGLFLDQTTRQ